MQQAEQTGQPKPLEVLILEDNRFDADLMLFELHDAGFCPRATIVTNEDQFVRSLSPQVDVILADYTLPGMDAPQALACLNKSGFDIPLIIVSGTVGEETALAAIRIGAADYILKDRMLRLGPAVRDAIEKTQMRRDKRAADQLTADREKRFRALIECSSDGILMLTRDFEILYASPAASRMLHAPSEALVGENLLSFINGKAAATVTQHLRMLAAQRDKTVVTEFRCRPKTGKRFWADATIRNLLSEPAVAAIVVNFRDITARVDNARKLAARSRQLASKNVHLARNSRRLEELNAAANQNIANVSHDFRTPLTVLGEFCSLLREGHGGPLSIEQSELASVMAARIDDLELMVENMLDASAGQAGITLTFRSVFSLPDICESVSSLLKRKAEDKGIALDYDFPDDLPPVLADCEKFQRVIVNLAMNALKFTPAGGQVTLWSRNDPQTSEVTVGLSDNGPGISENDLKVIFDRFRKLGTPSEATGYGLGLNITAEFVRLNLGQMHVSSCLGKGSTFSFTVPHAKPNAVFERYIGLLTSSTECPQYASLLTVGVDHENGHCRSTDLDHLLRLRLHSRELAYPFGQMNWCIVVPFGESEASGFMNGLKTEWMHFRMNRPAVDLSDLALNRVGTWKIARDMDELSKRFIAVVNCDGPVPIVSRSTTAAQ